MNVFFGNTTLIKNGTQKNMWKFGTTERTQLVQPWMVHQYDFEGLKDILSKCIKE